MRDTDKVLGTNAYDREVRDQLFDDLIGRTDEIQGSCLKGEGFNAPVWIHSTAEVKRWLMDIRQASYEAR